MDFLTFMRDFGGLLMWAFIILFYVILFIYRHVKASKSGVTETSEISLSDIYEKIPKLVANAEALFDGKGKGSAKFDHVLTHLKLDAVDAGFKLDVDKVSDMINDIVKATKAVNIGLPSPIPFDDKDND